jgi:hypothetical protein
MCSSSSLPGVLQDLTCTKRVFGKKVQCSTQRLANETIRTIPQQSLDDDDDDDDDAVESHRIGEDITVLDFKCPCNFWSRGARRFWVSKFSAKETPACDNDSCSRREVMISSALPADPADCESTISPSSSSSSVPSLLCRSHVSDAICAGAERLVLAPWVNTSCPCSKAEYHDLCSCCHISRHVHYSFGAHDLAAVHTQP